MEKKYAKHYTFLFFFAVAVACAVLGYYWRSRINNDRASDALAKLDEEVEGIKHDEKKNMAKRYRDLYKKYPSTKAGRTACYKAGQIYYEERCYDDVIKTLQSCPAFVGEGCRVLEVQRQKMLGEAYRYQGRYQEAIACYLKATEKDYGHQAICLKELADIYGKCYDKEHDVAYLAKALESLKKAHQMLKRAGLHEKGIGTEISKQKAILENKLKAVVQP